MSSWTPQEDEVLLQSKMYLGLSYGKISDRLGDRSRNAVRHRWDILKNKFSKNKAVEVNRPKILIFDIETSPMEVYSFGVHQQYINPDHVKKDWYVISWAAKWLDETEIHSSIVTPEESKKGDDRRVVSEMWLLLDKADIVVAHNCVEENTPVLTQDLRWVPARQLRAGDKIVGFDEATIPGEPFRNSDKEWIGTKKSVRRIKPTTVLSNKLEKQRCMEVILSNGEKIITTPDHYWLGRTKKDNFYKWIKTEDLQPGYRFTKFWNVWETDASYDAGWLSGFLDGEGTLRQSGNSFGIDFCQRPGVVWDKAIKTCQNLGFTLSKRNIHHPSGIGKQDTLYTGLTGGKFRLAEIIGRLRIEKFLDLIDWENFGGLKGQYLETVEVASVTDAGERTVAVLATTEKTFFASGYAMHNCDRFDNKKLKWRFLKHGFAPPSAYKTVDTLRVARSQFGATSNKLDYLAKELGLGRKTGSHGFETWVGCLEGNKEALADMLHYNINDIVVLENIYLELLPWISNHPNLGLFDSREINICPNCGSDKIDVLDKVISTSVNSYYQYRCNSCNHVGRTKILATTKEKRLNILSN